MHQVPSIDSEIFRNIQLLIQTYTDKYKCVRKSNRANFARALKALDGTPGKKSACNLLEDISSVFSGSTAVEKLICVFET